MTLHSAAPAAKLIARAFMGDLIVAVRCTRHGSIGTGIHVGCRRDRRCARKAIVICENSFGVLALTAPILRRSQSKEPCGTRNRKAVVALALDALLPIAPSANNFSYEICSRRPAIVPFGAAHALGPAASVPVRPHARRRKRRLPVHRLALRLLLQGLPGVRAFP